MGDQAARSRRASVSADDIIIVGGGLGGLATALALGRAGRRVRVLEQAQEFGAIGYGIQLGPNVFPMFERLGIKDAVIAAGDIPEACILVDAFTGEEVVRLPTGATLKARFGHPYLIIHRIDLHHALIEACRACPTVTLVPGALAVRFEDGGSGVTVETADGRRFEGAALIAADGLRSGVRASLRNESEPRQSGYVAHRTLLPMDQVSDTVPRRNVHLRIGPGFHIVHYPLRHGTVLNMVAVFRTSTYLEKLDIAAYRAEIDRTYAKAHPLMHTMLAMMDLTRRWPIADRDPIRQWHRGRVALVGDAAHPTLQSLAQGACMAIEDGVCLAALIELAEGDFAQAFAQYESERCVRTARVQLESRYLWELYHADDVARDVAREIFVERSEDDMFRCLAWLYDGCPVPARLRPTAKDAPKDVL
jgi:2-polyprenyl-6-methoxyphenol hydroxylase-like FAD-dependent oxidoreductase